VISQRTAQNHVEHIPTKLAADPGPPQRPFRRSPHVNPDGEKDLYNSRQPADDVANYLEPWSKVLEKAGYPPEQATEAALQVLPDILRYNRTKPPFYPNGRRPIEDIYSYRWAWLTYGNAPPTGLKPHADLLTDFPCLGPPNP